MSQTKTKALASFQEIRISIWIKDLKETLSQSQREQRSSRSNGLKNCAVRNLKTAT